jgi:signal peptidase I
MGNLTTLKEDRDLLEDRLPDRPEMDDEAGAYGRSGLRQEDPDPLALSETPPTDAGVAPTPDEAAQRGSVRPLLVEILQTVLLTLVIFMGVRGVVQNFKVDGASMEPTLHSGQYLLINKVSYFRLDSLPEAVTERLGVQAAGEEPAYLFGGPERGDIIVFRFPGRPERDFIKRVIGVPGDVIEIDRGRVYVNGDMLQEEYIRTQPTYSVPTQTVPAGQYFVLGDNRPNSSDSHIWGYVPADNVIGKAWVSYWPPEQWGIVAESGIASTR